MRCRGQACRDSRRNRKVKQPMAGKGSRASRLNLRHAKLAAGIVWWRHCGGGGLIPRGLGGLPCDEGQHLAIAIVGTKSSANSLNSMSRRPKYLALPGPE